MYPVRGGGGDGVEGDDFFRVETFEEGDFFGTERTGSVPPDFDPLCVCCLSFSNAS